MSAFGRFAIGLRERGCGLGFPLHWALAFLLSGCCALGAAASANPRAEHDAFPAQFHDAALFMTAIAAAAKNAPAPRALSGITVPHHLVAADLIASAFQMVDPDRIDKVIVLFPDHFKRARLPFATTRRPFETVFGRIEVSQPDVGVLLQSRALVDESDLFATDHGIGAVLPFIKHRLSSAKIVPIAVSLWAGRQDWDKLVERLKQIAGPTTLVVQSTDFSHHLPPQEAVQRDQEVLNLLAAGRSEPFVRLRQPHHTDSRGSQYVQVRLQQEVFRARPLVLFNSNSHAYEPGEAAQTTSYVVQLYDTAPANRVGADASGSKVYCFAGDTFFGRGVLRAVGSHSDGERVQNAMRYVLNDCRLIVNLTGVLVPDLPINLDSLTLAMPSSLTVDWLRALNVVAVSVANNHTMDLGRPAFDQMVHLLTDAGIVVLRQGVVLDLGPFRLAAFTDRDNWTRRSAGMISDRDAAQLATSAAKPPLFAMVNWGGDYQQAPGPRELALIEAFRQAAVSLIIGVHPHLATTDVDLLGGGQALSAFSLGNFLFDQSSQRASGAVLEIRVFEQGTFFARLIPIPNFIEDAAKQRGSN